MATMDIISFDCDLCVKTVLQSMYNHSQYLPTSIEMHIWPLLVCYYHLSLSFITMKMVDYKGINAIHVSFAPHLQYELVHTFLNGYYGGSLFAPQIDGLFSSTVKIDLHDNAINVLYDLIINELIYPVVTQNMVDPDKSHYIGIIAPIVHATAYKVSMTSSTNNNGMHLT